LRVLLDTNILIHREAATVVRSDIGTLFQWLDRLHYEKRIHPVSAAEIAKHRDPRVRDTFKAKLSSYHELKTIAALAPEVVAVGAQDATDNDRNDTLVINELFAGRVDFLISEDRGIAHKARRLGIGDRVLTIDAFLEKVTAENPNLVHYKVLAVQKRLFGEVPLAQPFLAVFTDLSTRQS